MHFSSVWSRKAKLLDKKKRKAKIKVFNIWHSAHRLKPNKQIGKPRTLQQFPWFILQYYYTQFFPAHRCYWLFKKSPVMDNK